MKAILRIAMAWQALIGKMDDLPEKLDRMVRVEASLRKAIVAEERQKRYWYDLWVATSAGHQQAQSIMAAEIDSLVEMSSALVAECNEYRKQLKVEAGADWSMRLAKYREGGGFMALLEKYRENFVRTKHPEDIDLPLRPPEVIETRN